ncbi:YeiH family protein [Rhodobacter maris]|uniref:Uncharacterized integral membrane protein (TIGR00698 family) n=1 Tax=Rhodobacter maris TaxID=446682 RepID=A0A285S6R9_9RHOB|nr:putative sulfate exporter family transporter [Rhodobacter maris]SOC02528.1 uncharacterized integral membrane protein (TIGR00698 family) [Rhodobacter maris]
MTAFASPAPRISIWPGVSLVAAIVAAAFLLRLLPGVGMFSPLIIAILIGVVVRNTYGLPAGAVPGLAFSLRRLLRAGIVVLGLQLTLGQVLSVGGIGLATILIALFSTYFFTLAAGRWLGVEAGLTRLIATGTSICGASAVLAANAVGRESDEDVAYAIASVTIFGTLAMVLFPMLGSGMSAHDYGLWAGASIHEVAQVVAAGAQGGPEATAFATIAKLTRVALLAPLILIMARHVGSTGRAPFPWFVLGFVAMVGLASTGWVPAPVTKAAGPLTQVLLAMGLAAMGLQTDVAKLRAKGVRPLALGLIASIFIAGLTFVLVIGAGLF